MSVGWFVGKLVDLTVGHVKFFEIFKKLKNRVYATCPNNDFVAAILVKLFLESVCSYFKTPEKPFNHCLQG